MVRVGESLEERADMLEESQWAEELPWKDIECLVRYLDVSCIEKGATVLKEGDREAYMGIIARGSVQVIKQDAQLQEKVLSLIGKGKTFGEMILFDDEPRSATIVAADHTVLLILTRENLDRLTKELPSLAAKLLMKLGRLLSQRLRLTSGKLVDFID